MRLSKQRRKLWRAIPSDEQQKYVDEYTELLQEVGRHFRLLPMQLYETQYFLFFSDIPPRQVAPYLRNLDMMNEQLGKAFGFPPGHNVWRGKAVIVAFVDKVSFVEFEQEFMKNIEIATVQGRCHSFTNGRVIVSCYRGNDPFYFAQLLVHETAHGYVHRYKSNVRIPSWLDEGIADWIAGVAVPASQAVRRRQEKAAARVRTTGTLGGQFFESTQIEGWQYGIASSLFETLLAQGRDRFRFFFNGIKEGLDWEQSLERTYRLRPAELTRLYGRTLGIPNLTP